MTAKHLCRVAAALIFAATQSTMAQVSLLTTTGDRSVDLQRSTIALSSTVQQDLQLITIDPGQRFQVIDGFGAAVTGSTCYNLMQMSPEARHKFLVETYSPTQGFGFSYARIAIGCSDFSLSEYTCCDTPGLDNFALTDEETKYVIPILKEILAINPALKIMGSPWTPPRWMKVDNLTDLKPFNSWTSGQLNPKYYQDYAEYFVRWIKAFNAEGIDIYSVTPQNEPLNRGNSASLYMPWEQERDFIATALGPALERAGLFTRIYSFDHNYNYDNIPDQQGYPLNIYDDAVASKYIKGTAFHNYGGDINQLDVVHAQAPAKDLVFSETSIGTWNDGRNLATRLDDDMRQVAIGTVNRWCKGVLVWNLMLDADRGPNREGGCKTCYGAVDISSDYKTITRNSHYYILAHMAAAARPGAVRVAANDIPGVQTSAFINPDGSTGLVLNNSNHHDVSIAVTDGTHSFVHTLPARSAISCVW